MLVWLDILTPKQVFFLGELGRRLEARGHSVFRTTRRYKEVDELLSRRNINALSVGRHGGASLEGKLAASAERIGQLTKIVAKLKPDLSVAFASPEAARVSFGLAIPHFTVNDSPHSEAVARLTIPLATKLFSPAVIPTRVWRRLGAAPTQIVQYNALDPIGWLRAFIPNPNVLAELGLDVAEPLAVFRVEEAFAAYLVGHVAELESVTIPIINQVLNSNRGPLQIVVLPRYLEQIQVLRAVFPPRVIVPRTVIDGPSLLFFASVFVGAGGTMTAEAALLGTPTISCFPREPTIVETHLIKNGLVYRQTKPVKVAAKIQQILASIDDMRKTQREKARTFTATMEDPIDVIVQEIEGLA